jgi:hypothetical protein
MHEEARIGDVDLRTAQAVFDAACQIVGSRQRLAAKNLPVVIYRHQVSERAANINRNSHEEFC